MTVLDLGSLPAVVLPPLPADLQGATYPVPFHHACPYCATRPAGLLEGHCGEPDCRTAYLDADQAFLRSDDHD